jgi:ribosomal protein L11 methyltransferase
MAIRIDISADKGTEEVLDSAFYALSGGVWIEDEAGGVRIICYPADPDRFCAYVRGSGMALRLLAATEEEEKDYAALVRRGFTPVRVGGVTILPPWRRPSKRGRNIVIEPGMAFGTGRHESTKLMIKMMERLPLEGRSVLDIGSGSGVLALCARRLGARLVAAFDRDPLAAEAMKKGCVLNDAQEILLACADIAAVKGRFDVVLANLDFAVFSRRAPEIVRLTTPEGYLVVSGVEAQYAKGLPILFEPLVLLRHHRLRDWHGFVFQKGCLSEGSYNERRNGSANPISGKGKAQTSLKA